MGAKNPIDSCTKAHKQTNILYRPTWAASYFRPQAVAIENADPHGNAAAIYTQSGAAADYFCEILILMQLYVLLGYIVYTMRMCVCVLYIYIYTHGRTADYFCEILILMQL